MLEDYDELKRVSARFRGLEPHTGQGYYREKWIENHFIDAFLDRPMSEFACETFPPPLRYNKEEDFCYLLL